MIVRPVLITAIFVSFCFAAACSGDTPIMAPSPTSAPSPTPVATITGRVTERSTANGIAGAFVTADIGPLTGPALVTDASGFYEIPLKTGHVHVTVSVIARRFIESSESVDVSDRDVRLDFQLMPALNQ